MVKATAWFPAPRDVSLAPSELHVWRVRCSSGSQLLQHYIPVLSPDEKERASRFVIEEARRDFIVTRSALRALLARYLNTPQASIVFRYRSHGKPYVFGGDGDSSVRFNVSHSHGFALLAFGLQKEVGVDIEQVRAEFPGREIAERFFSDRELAELNKLPPERSSEGFFQCWTRKEAYIKALGGGLQIPLRSFSVELGESGEQRLVDEEGRGWSLYPFTPGLGFAAAVAAAGENWELKYWEYPLED